MTSGRLAPRVAGLLTALAGAGRGVRWYVREVSGESKWDAYLERCRTEGTPALSRREFERHRAEHREHHTASCCC